MSASNKRQLLSSSQPFKKKTRPPLILQKDIKASDNQIRGKIELQLRNLPSKEKVTCNLMKQQKRIPKFIKED